MDSIQGILQQFDKIKSHRHNWESMWEDITEFVMPHRGDFTTKRAPGEMRTRRLFDSTAIQSNEFLAATLQGGLTNPSMKWANLRTSDTALNSIEEIKLFLEAATTEINNILSNPKTNFQSQNVELFQDLVAYGTACMYVEEDEDLGIVFKTIHLAEMFIAEDKNGLIDTAFRKFEMTVKQAAQTWGEDKLPPKMREMLEKSPEEKFEFIHCVKPNREYKTNSVKTDKLKFKSYYIALTEKAIITEGGYHEMPYLVPRWSKLVGEIYGRSPAWTSMTDIRMINVMSKTLIVAVEKQVDPPMLTSDDGVLIPLRTMPGGINEGALDMNGNPLVRPMEIRTDLKSGLEMVESRAKSIRNAYFIDPLMNSPIKSNVTREEILQRQEEKLRIIGPQIGRIQAEYLSPLIERIYSILGRNGILPELSDEVSDAMEQKGLKIEYTAPLARTHRSNEPVAFQRLLQSFLPLVQIEPTLMDNVNFGRAFKEIAEIIGVPSKMLNSEEEMAKIAEERQQAQQQAQQMQMMDMAAQRLGDLKKSGILDEEPTE